MTRPPPAQPSPGAGRADRSWVFWEPESRGPPHHYVASILVAMAWTHPRYGLSLSLACALAREGSGEGAVPGFGS